MGFRVLLFPRFPGPTGRLFLHPFQFLIRAENSPLSRSRRTDIATQV